MTMTAPPTTPTSPPARNRLIRTRARWIAGTTLLVVLGATAFSLLEAPTYESTADVVVLPLVTPNVTPQTPSMATERSLVLSDVVATDAARDLGMPLPQLLDAASVTVPAQTETLEITCSTSDAVLSARCAQALAESYVRYKDSQPIMTLPERGRVITPSVVPPSPATPDLLLNLLAGLLVGLVLGFVVAALRDRLDSRVRAADDLEQRGLRVLGVVPARGAGAGGGAGSDEQARAFGSLAAKVRGTVGHLAASGTAADAGPAPVVVVTAVAEEDTVEAPAAATALATALAAAGDDVVLVHADTGSPTGTPPEPGLLDLLAGRVDLADATHAGSHPGLRTVGVGRRPPARIGVREWSQTSARLAAGAGLVVVAADPMLLSANGLTVTQGADAVVAVAVAQATSRSDVDAFVRECRELGLPLAGAALTVDTVRPARRGTRTDEAGWGAWAEHDPQGSAAGAGGPDAEEAAPAEAEAEAQPEPQPEPQPESAPEPEPGPAPWRRIVRATVVTSREPDAVREPAPGRTENNGTGAHPVPPA